jgi:hypothetical protein
LSFAQVTTSTMRFPLLSLLCVLTAWHAFAEVNVDGEATIALRRQYLRKLQSDFEDFTEAPAPVNITTSAGDVFDSEPVSAPTEEGDFPARTEPPTAFGGMQVDPEGAVGGDDEGDGEEIENLGDEGDGENTPAPASVEADNEVGEQGGDDFNPPDSQAGGDEVTEGPAEAPSESSEAGEAPTVGGGTGDETPTTGSSGGGENDFVAPTATGGGDMGGDEAPSAAGDFGFGPVSPPSADNVPTQFDRTHSPTAGRPAFDDFPAPTAPVPTPTFAQPTAPFPTPTNPPPTPTPYRPKDDDENDPIFGPDGESSSSEFSTNDDWGWNNSSVQELEHDQTVITALSVTFGVMFLFSVFVAYQMLENPHGCCASICRITVACFCGILRIVCYPCRAICGCTGQSKRDHMIVPDGHGNYTHDLELT